MTTVEYLNSTLKFLYDNGYGVEDVTLPQVLKKKLSREVPRVGLNYEGNTIRVISGPYINEISFTIKKIRAGK